MHKCDYEWKNSWYVIQMYNYRNVTWIKYTVTDELIEMLQCIHKCLTPRHDYSFGTT